MTQGLKPMENKKLDRNLFSIMARKDTRTALHSIKDTFCFNLTQARLLLFQNDIQR